MNPLVLSPFVLSPIILSPQTVLVGVHIGGDLFVTFYFVAFCIGSIALCNVAVDRIETDPCIRGMCHI
jgi:hypothetical protein